MSSFLQSQQKISPTSPIIFSSIYKNLLFVVLRNRNLGGQKSYLTTKRAYHWETIDVKGNKLCAQKMKTDLKPIQRNRPDEPSAALPLQNNDNISQLILQENQLNLTENKLSTQPMLSQILSLAGTRRSFGGDVS